MELPGDPPGTGRRRGARLTWSATRAAAARTWRRLDPISVAVPTALYLLLGKARSVQMNPFIPGAVVAVNMIVPVLAGILKGRRVGLAVGLLGTSLNAITSHDDSLFEYAAIVPHGLMGLAAGMLRERVPSPLPAFALVVGHLLNLTSFALFGLMSAAELLKPALWYGIGSETLVGAVAVSILTAIYRLGFEPGPR